MGLNQELQVYVSAKRKLIAGIIKPEKTTEDIQKMRSMGLVLMGLMQLPNVNQFQELISAMKPQDLVKIHEAVTHDSPYRQYIPDPSLSPSEQFARAIKTMEASVDDKDEANKAARLGLWVVGSLNLRDISSLFGETKETTRTLIHKALNEFGVDTTERAPMNRHSVEEVLKGLDQQEEIPSAIYAIVNGQNPKTVATNLGLTRNDMDRVNLYLQKMGFGIADFGHSQRRDYKTIGRLQKELKNMPPNQNLEGTFSVKQLGRLRQAGEVVSVVGMLQHLGFAPDRRSTPRLVQALVEAGANITQIEKYATRVRGRICPVTYYYVRTEELPNIKRLLERPEIRRIIASADTERIQGLVSLITQSTDRQQVQALYDSEEVSLYVCRKKLVPMGVMQPLVTALGGLVNPRSIKDVVRKLRENGVPIYFRRKRSARHYYIAVNDIKSAIELMEGFETSVRT